VAFLAFDVLWVDGERVTHRPLRDRKAILALHGPAWREAPWQVGDCRGLLAACEELRLEGIVAERLDSIYRPGARTTLWRKKKCRAWLEEQLPRRLPVRLARFGKDQRQEPREWDSSPRPGSTFGTRTSDAASITPAKTGRP
jgi:ATP-dependent DNA ligase